MRRFERPEIKVKSFDRVSVLTASDPAAAITAVEEAYADAKKTYGGTGAYIVDIG